MQVDCDSGEIHPSEKNNTALCPSSLDITAQFVLSPVLSVEEFRRACFFGIHHSMRPLSWKLLLGHLPRCTTQRVFTMINRRRDYAFLVYKYYHSASQTLQEQIIMKQIKKDIPRTKCGILFNNDNLNQMMCRILYIWSVHHPETAYCQGMNEILVPFIHVFIFEYLVVNFQHKISNLEISAEELEQFSQEDLFEIEVDANGCFSNLMNRIKSLFIANQMGKIDLMSKMQDVVNCKDPELFNHLIEIGISFKDFAFQWFHCLLVREFDIQEVLRIWDTYISIVEEHESSVLIYHSKVCAFILLEYSDELKQMNFEEAMIFIINKPMKNWSLSTLEPILFAAMKYKD